jgi:general secretion pathway protein I
MIFNRPETQGRTYRGHGNPGCRNNASQHGFTLIEVVVALAIVVVSFMALYGVIMQMVNATILMQEKTFASWVAFDRITEFRLKGEFTADTKSNGIAEMAGSTWIYSIEVKSTGSENIRQLIVTVAPEDEPERTLGLVSGVVLSNVPLSTPSSADPGNPNQPPPVTSGASPDWGATQ